MKALTVVEATQQIAKLLQKPCMYLNFAGGVSGEDWVNEITQAAPYLNVMEHGQMMADGVGIFIFENEDEMYKIYDQTKGDDPNEVNLYAGPARIYALTCNAKGELTNENT